MSETPNTRRLWRIVKTNPPTRDDFVSPAERGEPPPDDSELARLKRGLSMYATEAQARRNARHYRNLGPFLAAVDVPLDGRCEIERTLNAPGHYTVWGEAALLHDAVALLRPVTANSTEA